MKRIIKYYLIFILTVLISVVIYINNKEDKNDNFVSKISKQTSLKNVVYEKKINNQIGYIESKGVIAKSPVYYGENDLNLSKGVSLDATRKLPNQKGQTVLAAHRETFFKEIGKLDNKSTITLRVLNKKYTYKVTSTIIVYPDAGEQVYKESLDHNELVLITCYPFSSWKDPAKRYIVFAKIVKVEDVK